MERRSRVPWRSGVALRAGLLAAICAGLTGCGLAAGSPSNNADSRVLSCASAPLSVTFDESTLKAVNTGNRPCVLSGHRPVDVPWWRIVGPRPSAATGTLAPGAALLQAYRMEEGNGCPGTLAVGDRRITVSVEGKPHVLTLPAKIVHEIKDCQMVSAIRPTIQPAAAS